jgi:hypothetical protein
VELKPGCELKKRRNYTQKLQEISRRSSKSKHYKVNTATAKMTAKRTEERKEPVSQNTVELAKYIISLTL